MREPLWQPTPDQLRLANLTRFCEQVRCDHGARIPDDPGPAFAALHDWSVAHPGRFWRAVASFAGVVAETWGETALEHGDRMPGARFFPDARLSFAENLLQRGDDDDDDAIVFRGEEQVERRLSCGELRRQVGQLAAALRSDGVGSGDRVAGYLPNLPETVVAMLATTSLGAIWTSSSPDFGVQAVLDRFGQIEPKVLFAADEYRYKGQAIDLGERVSQIAARLPSLTRTVLVPYDPHQGDVTEDAARRIAGATTLAGFVAGHPAAAIATFERFPFDHPLYIMYSSGTTGAPKCIVHGAGGTLLQHAKEHRLHCDVRPRDRVFHYTTCGWMMWNWLVSALAAEATLLLFDGAPFHPTPAVLFDYAEAEGMTLLGTSAKYIDALRVITSTGSPLSPDGFDYVYQRVKPSVQLSSISGGTDIIGCFVLGNPIGSVWRGEIQARGLGMAIDVFDPTGRPLRAGTGELVCTAPFPSMPVGFWSDPDGARYRAAYFERFAGVWHQGDWAELTTHGGLVIHGRSDAVLNPGGVRIGTAEIYNQVERIDEVLESVAIGQPHEDDIRVVLFVVLRPAVTLNDELVTRIKRQLRQGASPRHVPAKVVQVADIPRTQSGKISEIAVREVVCGRPVSNTEALANPEALELFADLPELRD